ncbi:bifunctional DedA family/phosphatase PAP2 family protein [Collimonas sp.]|jgi:membrane protein DedA with SNARE-associated domain/membrane-associated phospholipid phosphatase|uniref:bifunctional DedA family/phosphatase PAP2 family protein n=1 Tax=Collimonas sp. TaxID=1963772 RepID=UPI002B685723|nr:phosphatase PAP2 family protein [Collimonas sp.]HWW08302.1 phosphatase PAP2 family protein [Collimonas sp.]
MHALLNDIAIHPHWVLLVVFLVALAESLLLIGTLVPAGIVMFTAGALIGAGALNVWLTLGIAAVGAVIGDGLSYEVGRAYYQRLRTWQFVKRRSAMIDRGEQFVQRHGGKSILFARFFAPVRAVVPAIAGIAHMPRAKFYAVNLGSALAWSPAHILPGVVFGASLQLAQAVSGRLALILLMLVALVWSASWATRFGIRNGLPVVEQWRDRLLQWASRQPGGRFTRIKSWVFFFLDPRRPESQILPVLALLLVGSSWLFLGIVEDVITSDPLVGVDAAIFHWLQGLRTSAVDHLMVGVTELGGASVLWVVALTVLGWLLARRCWRTAGYWVITAAFAQVLVKLLKWAIGRPRPLNLYSGVEQYAFPSGHATSSMVIYGFLAFLIARRQPPLVRMFIAAVTVVGIALIGFSRLYLGAHWLSDVLAGWSLGLAWIVLMAIVYTNHQVKEELHPRILGALSMAALLAGAAWSMHTQFPADLARYTPAAQLKTVRLDQWLHAEWRQLPRQRTEISGDNEEFFSLQWADSATTLQNRLALAGWQPAAAWSLPAALLWLAPNTEVKDLPVLPKYDQGKSSELAFVALDPARPMTRMILRLWQSDYLLEDPAHRGNVPIWYGALYQEELRRPWHLFTLGRTVGFPDASLIPRLLQADMQTAVLPDTQSGLLRQIVLILPEGQKVLTQPISGRK